MRIAIASLGDPESVATWSGIPHHIARALSGRGHSILPISLRRPPEPWRYRWLRRYYHRVHGKGFLPSVEERWLKKISTQLEEAADRLRPDVVLVIHADWLAYATLRQPACIIHDTTFETIVDYYPSFSNLCERSLRMGHRMYAEALGKASAAVFSANWAAQSAFYRYGYPQQKTFTMPFGANISSQPDEDDVRRWALERCARETCNLLFIGTQWERKGGPDILRFVRALRRLGVPATLTIVGCTPDIPEEVRAHVSVAGYLRKDDPADFSSLTTFLRQAHALIALPQAECYGCVFCEANAFGVPALGRDTGGVSEIIREGVNGLMLAPCESPEQLAYRWSVVWRDPGAYQALSMSSYYEFRNRLNYDVFADRLEEVLMTLTLNPKVLQDA